MIEGGDNGRVIVPGVRGWRGVFIVGVERVGSLKDNGIGGFYW